MPHLRKYFEIFTNLHSFHMNDLVTQKLHIMLVQMVISKVTNFSIETKILTEFIRLIISMILFVTIMLSEPK